MSLTRALHHHLSLLRVYNTMEGRGLTSSSLGFIGLYGSQSCAILESCSGSHGGQQRSSCCYEVAASSRGAAADARHWPPDPHGRTGQAPRRPPWLLRHHHHLGHLRLQGPGHPPLLPPPTFLWVVKSPSDGGDASEAYFTVQSKEDPFRFLPAGFVDRTREVGLLVPSWAPQAAVLNHAATGGFLSHCGWNSTLESVKAGVPMVAWPLFAEQRQNAVMLAEGSRIALRLPRAEQGIVPREEVARVVKELMEGEEGKAAHQRVAELREASARCLEEGGAAYTALDAVGNKWKATN
ncbi:UDP-glycosyltransferase 72B1-like [Musa acuminata AAA Group]|uniref:UDP-glycosyltransferase 72B1-like n=1 Tax=Musa acuminata AAA Group TaxID=214697 RepID=UPI0031E14C49